MSRSIRTARWLAAALALAAVRPASAQRLYVGAGVGTFVGVGLGAFVASGRGIETSYACAPNTLVGLSFTGGHRVWRGVALQAATHLHVFYPPTICVEVPLPPRPDGTSTEYVNTGLFAARFVMTDLRLRLGGERGGSGAAVTLGGGAAWRAGDDLPYVLAGASVHAPLGALRFVVRGELYHMRVRFDIVEETWLDRRPVSVATVGVAHEWNSAGRVEVGLVVPLGR